jgi:hypothetical protein
MTSSLATSFLATIEAAAVSVETAARASAPHLQTVARADWGQHLKAAAERTLPVIAAIWLAVELAGALVLGTWQAGRATRLAVEAVNNWMAAIAGDLADPTRHQQDADVPRAEQPAEQPAEQQPTAPVAPTAPAAPHLPVLAPAPRRRVSLAGWLQADGWDDDAVADLVRRRPYPQGMAA